MAENFLALIDSHKAEIESLLPKYLTPERFFTLARMVEKDPNLRSCTPQSLFECVLKAAQCGLEIGTVDQHAYIIPYKNEATFQPSYRGLIFRLVNAGVVVNMYADVVRKGDFYEMISGTERRFVHKPAIFAERGDVIGAYAVATLPNGLIDFEIMELRDLEAIERAALRISGGKPSPAWAYFKSEMQKKSVIRRHAKRLQGDRRGLINNDEATRLDLTFAATKPISGEPEEPDDTPTAKGEGPRAVHAEIVNDKLNLKPDAQEPISESDQEMLMKVAKQHRVSLSNLVQMLYDKFGIDDLSGLKKGQVAEASRAIEEAAV